MAACAPQWLVIKEDDDDKTVARKKKLIKSYKSKKRFHNMDMAQKKKADSWQSFNQGKGTKKKTGYFTGKRALLFARSRRRSRRSSVDMRAGCVVIT